MSSHTAKEAAKRAAVSQKRLRGHRIKSGLEELGDLGAPRKVARTASQPKAPASASSAGAVAATAAASSTTTAVANSNIKDGVCKSLFGHDWSEWRGIKEVIFNGSASPREKQEAMRRFRVWHARVRKQRTLPSYVEATELLMNAVLVDEGDASGGSNEGAQSVYGGGQFAAHCYGAAISRAVHVMTGSFATGEGGTTYRKRAREIGFPEEAVEVRQRVAHGALPLLSELRWVCGLVLQFLFQEYWVEQERHIKLMEEEEAEERAGNREATGAASSSAFSGLEAVKSVPLGGGAPAVSIEEMEQLLSALNGSSDEDEEEEDASVTVKVHDSSATASPVITSGWTLM